MRILIIGNGIAGITAAITIRRLSGHEITVVSSESAHFYARTALMYLYLGQLKYEHIKGYEDWFWTENNITLKQGWVNAIDFALKTASLQSGETLNYDKLILATGSKTNFQDLPGQNLKGVHGFYSLQDLENIEKATSECREAVIVGGGLVGIELAEMLHSRGIKITMLIRDNWYWGRNFPESEARMIEKILTKNGILFRLKTTLQQLEADETGNVCAARITGNEKLPCTFVGIATGVTPNLDLTKNTSLQLNKGILVNEFLETSEPDVYAIGDCAELTFASNHVEQLWYTGRMQGETVAHTICGKKTSYQRSIPFNSAKFFDLEFQSYGLVNPELEKNFGSFLWQHSEKNLSLRLNYRQNEPKTICGFVLLGIRFRQEICETWIKDEKPLEYVLQNLEQAFFDPEFEKNHKNAILKAYKTREPCFEIKKKSARFSWF